MKNTKFVRWSGFSPSTCRSLSRRGGARGLLLRLFGIRIWEPKVVVGNSSGFTQATQEGAVHCRRVITDRVLTWNETTSSEIAFHLVWRAPILLTRKEQTRHLLFSLLCGICRLLLLGMWGHGCGQQVVITARGADRHKAVGAACPRIRPPSGCIIIKKRKIQLETGKKRRGTKCTHLVTTVSFGCGTALLPKIPFSTAIQRPTITSSLTFSMMAALCPATRARRTGD